MFNSTDGAGVVPVPAVGHYTICPVLVASNIAVALGWLDEECARAGVRLDYLRSLPDNVGWLAHFRHSVPTLVRDGGAITTLWGRAQGIDTVLVAVSDTQTGGQVLARADADVDDARALAGRRVALPLNQNPALPDFARAIASHGVGEVLSQAGLPWSSVAVVDVPLQHATPPLQPSANPSALWTQLRALQRGAVDPEAAAVLEGRADVLFSYASRTSALLASGQFKVVADLSEDDGLGRISNGPYTTAVNRSFAEAHPEAVVAFLRAAIRAGHWVNAHRDEAAEHFTRMTYYHDAAMARQAIGERDFVPSLAPAALQSLAWLKDRLRDDGYLQGGDFSMADWVDPRYLDEAQAGR